MSGHYKQIFIGERDWIELVSVIERVSHKQEKLMSQVDDLNNGVGSLAVAIQGMDAQVKAVAAFILAQPNLSDAVSTAVKSLSDMTSKVAADTAELTRVIPGATTISPPTPSNQTSPQPVANPVVVPTVTVTAPDAVPPAPENSGT